MTTTITLFSWGYYGWGNHTPRLVQAVDAVEASRGFEPPIFVDIRIRRSVRAAGFNGPAFERLLGEQRYRWMKSLGNTSIVTGRGHHEIAEPKAAEELLDLAVQAAKQKRRVVFFCSCPWPRWEGKNACHRSTVAGLVLTAAKRRGLQVEIVEWPGGAPKQTSLEVTPKDLAAVRKGRTTVPLGERIDLAELAGLPPCSIATFRAGDEQLHRAIGPVIRQKGGWALPVLFSPDDSAIGLTECRKQAVRLRKYWGFEPSRS